MAHFGYADNDGSEEVGKSRMLISLHENANAVAGIGYAISALPMELIWLEDYLALAETLNFSRAAEARHVTQPAFSRRIRALEDWIGAALFTRTTHSVVLTPAGEHFHNHAQLLTRALHQLRRGCWWRQATSNSRSRSKSDCFVRWHDRATRSKPSGRPCSAAELGHRINMRFGSARVLVIVVQMAQDL
jgi:hypothetical protein